MVFHFDPHPHHFWRMSWPFPRFGSLHKLLSRQWKGAFRETGPGFEPVEANIWFCWSKVIFIWFCWSKVIFFLETMLLVVGPMDSNGSLFELGWKTKFRTQKHRHVQDLRRVYGFSQAPQSISQIGFMLWRLDRAKTGGGWWDHGPWAKVWGFWEGSTIGQLPSVYLT